MGKRRTDRLCIRLSKEMSNDRTILAWKMAASKLKKEGHQISPTTIAKYAIEYRITTGKIATIGVIQKKDLNYMDNETAEKSKFISFTIYIDNSPIIKDYIKKLEGIGMRLDTAIIKSWLAKGITISEDTTDIVEISDLKEKLISELNIMPAYTPTRMPENNTYEATISHSESKQPKKKTIVEELDAKVENTTKNKPDNNTNEKIITKKKDTKEKTEKSQANSELAERFANKFLAGNGSFLNK